MSESRSRGKGREVPEIAKMVDFRLATFEDYTLMATLEVGESDISESCWNKLFRTKNYFPKTTTSEPLGETSHLVSERTHRGPAA
jgi:hypothetical protein